MTPTLWLGLLLAVLTASVLDGWLRAWRGMHCEHGVPDGDWCPACNLAYKLARKEAGDLER